MNGRSPEDSRIVVDPRHYTVVQTRRTHTTGSGPDVSHGLWVTVTHSGRAARRGAWTLGRGRPCVCRNTLRLLAISL